MAKFFHDLAEYHAHQQQYGKLLELDDHMLADMGLTRHEVMRHASMGFFAYSARFNG